MILVSVRNFRHANEAAMGLAAGVLAGVVEGVGGGRTPIAWRALDAISLDWFRRDS